MGLVSGKVVDDEGRPVAGARVFFSSSPGATPDVALVTGDDGTFVMAAPTNGRYEITTFADEHGSATAPVDVQDDAAQPVELRVSSTK